MRQTRILEATMTQPSGVQLCGVVGQLSTKIHVVLQGHEFWPWHDWHALCQQGLCFFGTDFTKLALTNLRGGLQLTTDYSGIGSPEEALTQMLGVASHMAASVNEDFPEPHHFCSVRVGDIARHCRQILEAHVGFLKPRCVFGDILDRCPQEAQQQMSAVLEDAAKKLGKHAADKKAKRARLEVGRDAIREMASFMLDVSAAGDVREVTAHCDVHQGKCHVIHRPREGFEGLHVHIAGVNCYDWSSMGSKTGWLGESTPIFMQWVRERKLSLEDLVIVECVLHFDHEMLAELLQDEYDLKVVRVSPVLFGEPTERHRKYMLLLRKGRLTWHPSVEDDEGEIEAAFNRLFARTAGLPVECKFRAPASYLDDFCDDLAIRMKMPRRTSSGKRWSCFQLATPAVRASITGHEAALSERIGSDASHLGWICNLSQRPGYLPAVQNFVPALLRSSKLWLFALRRWPLPLELLEVQGFNIFGSASCRQVRSGRVSSEEECELADQARCGFAHAFNMLMPHQLQSVSGNGMHLRVIGAALLFSFGCAQRTGHVHVGQEGVLHQG